MIGRSRSRRAVALMLTLWLIVILGVVAAVVASSTRAEGNVVTNVRARTAARYAAESGIVLATARLDTLLTVARSPLDRAMLFRDLDPRLADLVDVRLGSARFAVAVTDANSRLDVNGSGTDVLVRLFSQFTDARHAEAAAAGIADWRDGDDLVRPHGAEADAYQRAGSIFVPPNGPIHRIDELSHVLGVGDSLFAVAARYLTVDSDGRVNINTAPEQVLAALPGMTPAAARELVSRRESGELFTSPNPIYELLDDKFNTSAFLIGRRVVVAPTRLRIICRGWTEGHALTHEIQAVYAVVGTRVRLISWRERDL